MIPETVCWFVSFHLWGFESLMARTIALLLHKKLEEALDATKIAIIPIPGAAKESTKWKAVVVDKTISNQQALYGDTRKWKVSAKAHQYQTIL